MSGHTNRLASETSLYLKQHAHNPVDWYPVGAGGARAARRNSTGRSSCSIGYSACHWCHVMEHESFEDEATAHVLNEHFVCIKVDREERPDLDTIYMTAVQLLTREGGGWPMSVFLTPDLTPFYAGTYFPPDDRYAPHRPSFKKLLLAIHDAWTDQPRSHSRGRAERRRLSPEHERPRSRVTPRCHRNCSRTRSPRLRRSFDSAHGGFGGAPKFPHALELQLLLRLAQRFDDKTALHMVRHTLDKMARGGMYDQLGGGFHRYSIDEKWLVPHFEKMLYDNALLTTGLPRGVPGDARPVLRADRRRDAGLRAARDDRTGRRVLQHPGRRQRGRGRQVLRLERGGDSRHPRRRNSASSRAASAA